jgi:bifunctional non-homologous end joining protein LigD
LRKHPGAREWLVISPNKKAAKQHCDGQAGRRQVMARKLDKYQEKRDTKKTLEPEGKIGESSEQLRFVVQHHDASRDHYDFRLEWEGVLLSWAVPKGPSYNPQDKRLAVEVEEHPLDYRNFEGTIPKGEYGGGTVMVWDEGEWVPRVDVEKGLKEGSLKFVLKGSRLKGKWALVRLKADNGNKKNWLLIKERDSYAQDDSGISEYATSVLTRRTMEEIEEEETSKQGNENRIPFEKTGVQLARLADSVPDEKGWVYEVKYDGYRILAYIEDNKVRLMTRNAQDYTSKFKSIADALTDWSSGRAMVLDGEVVVLDSEGRADFQALQGYLKSPKDQELTYVVFDLLAFSGKDLRMKPLKDRKKKLASLFEKEDPRLYYSNYTEGEGKDLFAAACEAELEGIICKKEESVYSGTRNGDWLKIKCENRQEFVIGGYTLSDKRDSGVSALLLGVYEGEDLIYTGRAGTGFTQKTRRDLESKFKKIQRKTPPFKDTPEERSGEAITWLSPRLVAEIRFAEWTDHNQLRQASYKGLRTDKDPKEVKRESPAEKNLRNSSLKAGSTKKNNPSGGKDPKKQNRNSIRVNGIRISSPDKEMFKGTGITKEDLAHYYLAAAERMMAHAGNRILSLVRCPEGIQGECFYQKHLTVKAKGLRVIPIKEKKGDKEDYFYLESADGLISAVQMGTLEFHTWGSRVDQLEKPDLVVFDLDPEEGMDLEKVREGVRDMKKVLDELSLDSFLKTSGGKGYHVIIPLKPSADWDSVKKFAKTTASAMEERWPGKYTSNMRKEKRKGKIFIDWVRNAKSATSVAPYSVRARKGAPVSMPISWEELDTVEPNGVDLQAALQRLKEDDPWKDFFQSEQKLSTRGSSD